MDENFNSQEIKDSDITYSWWCQECLDYHPTPWCPYANMTDALHQDVSGEEALVYDLCPTCGQVICR